MYKSKILLFAKRIYEWLSTFAPAYSGILPNNVQPEDLYLRYDIYFDSFASQFIFPVQIYKQKTTSYTSVILVADEIGNAVGEGGLLISDDDDEIKIKIDKGSPFYQNKPDEDETVRAGYINLLITIY